MSECISTNIWSEHASTDNPFVAKSCRVYGYDVFQDVLPHASYPAYLYLLFKGEAPDTLQQQLFEKLMIILAHPGIRDPSVRAAMNSGVGGSGNAASLMAALAIGAGSQGGAREVYYLCQAWQHCQQDLTQWQNYLQHPNTASQIDVWPDMQFPPGFTTLGEHANPIVQQSLQQLAPLDSTGNCEWLSTHLVKLETMAQSPANLLLVCSAILYSLKFQPEQAEMLTLLLRLPGAAIHALEQQAMGYKSYPFFGDKLTLLDDPKSSEGAEI